MAYLVLGIFTFPSVHGEKGTAERRAHILRKHHQASERVGILCSEIQKWLKFGISLACMPFFLSIPSVLLFFIPMSRPVFSFLGCGMNDWLGEGAYTYPIYTIPGFEIFCLYAVSFSFLYSFF